VYGHVEGLIAPGEQEVADSLREPDANLPNLLGRPILEQDHELVTAKPGDDLSRLQLGPDQNGKLLE
jgi:hypothetical protein